MLSTRRLRPLAVGVVACLALGARPAAAQEMKVDSTLGWWVGIGMLGGRTALDGNASRGWEQVGHPGPSVGGSAALGFDRSSFGIAIGAEATTLKVGGRSGSSVAVAATLRWRPPKPAASRWDPVIEIGYLQLGFGSARVAEAEIPSDLFRDGVRGDQAANDDLSLHGRGIRMGASVERGWRMGTNLVLGLGADVVRFDAATYEGTDKSLSRPGWGVMPRILLGLRIPARLGSGRATSEPI